VYVSNEDSGDVSVIDTSTDNVVATIAVGKRPRGMRVDPGRGRLYVAVSGAPKSGPGVPAVHEPPDPSADGIAVVDLGARSLVKRLPSGRDPETFALDRERGLLFVSNEESAEASVLDVGKERIEHTVAVGGEPEGVELRPDGAVAYVTSEADQKVSVLSTTTFGRVGEFQTGPRPRAVAFTADGHTALITNEAGASVTVADAVRHEPIATIGIDDPSSTASAEPRPQPRPMGIALSPDGTLAYVTTGRNGKVAVLDVAARRVAALIDGVGARPWGIGITRDGKKLYVANGASNDVAVIDTRERRVLKRIAAGRSPWGIALDGG